MKKVYPYLTFLGTIPFLFCAACLMYETEQLPLLGPVKMVMSTYALIIASFLAGSHWGQHFLLGECWSRSLPIWSNVIAVVLWFCSLTLGFQGQMWLFSAVFLALLAIDTLLFKEKVIRGQYFTIRCLATAVALVSLISSAIAA